MSIPVDPRYRLRATGNVEPVAEWGEGEGGKRVRLDTQATSPQGLPLWNLEVLRQVRNFGENKTVAVPVEVASRTMPAPPSFEPVAFENLSVEFFIRKGGVLGERWSAEGIADAGTDALGELIDEDQ